MSIDATSASRSPAGGRVTGEHADAVQLVARALGLVESRPLVAVRLATEALTASGSLPRQVRVEAQLALGRAAWARRDLATAIRALRAAARGADRCGLFQQGAQARLTLAAAYAEAGNGPAALRALAAAAPHLDGVDAARVAGQRAYLLHQEGHLSEALAGYQEALELFRRLGDVRRQAIALHNIAVLHTHAGDLARAARELLRAHDLFERAGEPVHAADAAANLGWVLARQGRIPEALRWFGVAEVAAAEQGAVDPHVLKDRAEALLEARLLPEALQSAAAAITEFERLGMLGPVAECRLLAARASLLLGEVAAARSHAVASMAAAGRRRPAVRALARYMLMRADLAAGAFDARLLRSARRAAQALEEQGWVLQALDVRLTAAGAALALGRARAARVDLVAVSSRAVRGTVQLRLAVWHARALLHMAEGDRVAARADLRAGVRVLDRYRDTLGATELQALATGHGLPLLALGQRFAVEAGDPWEALRWTERGRATTLRAVLRPAANPALAAELDALRQGVAATDDALLAGADARRSLARQAALEEAVRRRSRTTIGQHTVDRRRSLERGALRRALGRAVLLELFEHEGGLYGVLLPGAEAGRRPVLLDLGSAASATAELSALRFAAARLARGTRSPRSLEAAAAAVQEAAHRLDAQLLAPFADVIADAPLVLAPSGALHAVPWGVLPSCARRRVTVTPSAVLWMQTVMGPPPATANVVVVAGPGLPGAAREVAEVAAVHGGARLLLGPAATAPEVLAALDGARLAHVAAHGSFRADNPQLSSLRLTDGPLTVYDLETLRRPPHLLVLSACDTGLSYVRPGEEVQGLAAALLSLGADAVVASVTPVADDLAVGFAVDLHEELAAGSAPPAALATVRRDWLGRGPREAMAAASFVCFGGGGRSPS